MNAILATAENSTQVTGSGYMPIGACGPYFAAGIGGVSNRHRRDGTFIGCYARVRSNTLATTCEVYINNAGIESLPGIAITAGATGEFEDASSELEVAHDSLSAWRIIVN